MAVYWKPETFIDPRYELLLSQSDALLSTSKEFQFRLFDLMHRMKDIQKAQAILNPADEEALTAYLDKIKNQIPHLESSITALDEWLTAKKDKYLVPGESWSPFFDQFE